MPFYESTFIARQDISNQEVEKLTEQFSKVIKDNGGDVVKSEYWGLRSLAYEVKKNRKGHYVFLGLNAPFDAVKEMQRQMRFSENVLRNLTVRVEEISNDLSPILDTRESSFDQEDRGGRKGFDSSDNDNE